MAEICEYFSKLFNSSTFIKIKQEIEKNNSIKIDGLDKGEKALILKSLNKKFIYIANDLLGASTAKKILEDVGVTSHIIYSPISSPVLTLKNIDDTQCDMLNKIYDYLGNKVQALIIMPTVLCQRLPSLAELEVNKITLESGSNYNLKTLQEKLVKFGYTKSEGRLEVGEFSVRGDIVDICSTLQDEIYRIEFFDDEIEKIKICDKTSLELLQSCDKIDIHPLSVFFVNSSKNSDIFNKINKFSEKIDNYETNIQEKLKENIQKFQMQIEQGIESCHAFFQPFLTGFSCSILDLFSDHLICIDDTKKIKDEIDSFLLEHEASFSSLVEGGELLEEHKNFYLSKADIFKNKRKQIEFNSMTRDVGQDICFDISISQVRKYVFDYSALYHDLLKFREQGRLVVLFCGGKTESENIRRYMAENGLFFDDFSQEKSSGLFLSSKYLSYSLGFNEEKFIAIGTPDLIKKSLDLSIKNKSKVFYLPKVGDYVVHNTHGIGKCVGIEKLKLSSSYKDYFILEYKGGDRLYIPSEQANSISAYMGGESEPKLNKIGGVEFKKAKEKVYRSVQEMAQELVELYNQRRQKVGFCYSEDGYLQSAFEEAFVYEETDDQLQAIMEIKKDMQSNKIMDRLLCGDVGFGKTEVALRAAYKAVIDGKQVAFMCPTTILSQQHFATCQERFKDFMCNVEVINRFKTAKEQKQILEKLKKGDIDIICGTHRLLNDDVQFKDLGLLILDEEQRFGVADKEKIKKIKSDIDVLTLSATPIPRTLHMSLSGIRDISIIATPPKERLPVQTYVTEFSETILKDACLKEMARGGQVLIVFNRVDKIDQFVAYVKSLFPNVRVGYAHGQMDEKILEQTIYKLYQKEYQIFISTTLIENGVDLPLANTLFVVDSDKLGLSQLYQLRGRIGRGSRLAYAYFTYDASKKLTEQAYKRLEAIMQFRELGSGFKIAMRDLEIRGAGNVLGKQQHGQMQKVGYDLYCKILNSAIKELRGLKEKPLREVKLDIGVEAYIDPDYIGQEDARIKIYNSISELGNVAEMKKFISDIEKSFGKLATEAKNLIKIAVVKNLAMKAEISKITLNNRVFSINFYEKEEIVGQNVVNMVSQFSKFCVLKFAPTPIIEVSLPAQNLDQKLDFLLTILSQI